MLFSQKKVQKIIESSANEIEISTTGLDDFVIENSDTNFIEIILVAENSNEQHILTDEENNIFQIKLKNNSLKKLDWHSC